MIECTEDRILGDDIVLFQPKHGYRVAVDPFLLASRVEITGNQSILDVGCGVGTISLILKKLDSSQEISAVDIDGEMIELCKKNSEINALPLNIYHEGISKEFLKSSLFDCVITNPPFYQKDFNRISAQKMYANFETVSLLQWIKFCLQHLRNKGKFYMIHLPERLPEILSAFKSQVGNIEITPILSKPETVAKRIIIFAEKGRKAALKIMPPVIVHEENGDYTETVQHILATGREG